jgi:hypothetical protein
MGKALAQTAIGVAISSQPSAVSKNKDQTVGNWIAEC